MLMNFVGALWNLRGAALAVLVAGALASCGDTMGSLAGPNAKVAEVEPDSTGAAKGNIA